MMQKICTFFIILISLQYSLNAQSAITTQTIPGTTYSYNLKPGIYKFNNKFQFILQKDSTYEFKGLDKSRPSVYSQGKYSVKANDLIFLPDSNYLPSIKMEKAYSDSILSGQQKIILLQNLNNEPLSNFVFYFLNNNGDRIYLDSISNSKTYDISNYKRSQVTIYARLNDSLSNFMPGYYNKEIVSNVIDFSEIDVRKWNVLELKINIKEEMFGFVTLENYLIEGNKFVKKNWPVYKYSDK